MSGSCQFKTCWDQPSDFDVISNRIRQIYLTNSTQVELTDLGYPGAPELALIKADYRILKQPSPSPTPDRKADNMIYFQESPDYCIAQSAIEHPGTSGRSCRSHYDHLHKLNEPISSEATKLYATNKISIQRIEDEARNNETDNCDKLCCNRGHSSELVFDLVECNCRFKFCCTIECNYCLIQRVHHYCK